MREEKRAQILMALEQVCQDKRFHEVKLDDVAQLAGVGKGTIYRYFADKEDLFVQMISYGLDQLSGELDQYVNANGDFRERLVGLCQTIGEYFHSRASLARLIGEQEMRCHALDPQKQTAHHPHRQRLDAIVGRVLQQGQEEGMLRRDIPIPVATRLLMSMVRERNTTFADSPDRPEVSLLVELFLYGFVPSDKRNGA